MPSGVRTFGQLDQAATRLIGWQSAR